MGLNGLYASDAMFASGMRLSYALGMHDDGMDVTMDMFADGLDPIESSSSLRKHAQVSLDFAGYHHDTVA